MAQLWCIQTHVRPVSIIEQSLQKETQQIFVIKIDSFFHFRTKIGQTVTKFELNPTQKPILKNRTPGFK